MEMVSNPLQACNDIFFKPNRVFATIQQKDNWSWFPFIVVMLMAILPTYMYLNFVDFDWYVDAILQTQAGDLSPAEIDNMKQFYTRDSMLLWGVIMNVIITLVFNAIIAGYLSVVTKSDEENVNGFMDWYGFTWWAAMPVLFAGFAGMLAIALADSHQMSQVDINPLSLAFVLGLDMNSDWVGVASVLRLDLIWIIYLTSVGVSQWTNFDSKKSTIVAIAPYAVLFGLWAIITAI